MADEWYFMKNGRKIGPLSSKTLVDLAASGKLLPTDSIQKKGAASWQEAGAVKGLFPKAPVSGAAPATAVIEDVEIAAPLSDATPAFEHSTSITPPAIPVALNVGNNAALPVQRYKYLDWYITSSRTIARVVFALFAITGLYPFIIALMVGNSDALLTGLAITLFTLPFAAIIGYLLYMVQMAGADFLAVIRDIEQNTRSRIA